MQTLAQDACQQAAERSVIETASQQALEQKILSSKVYTEESVGAGRSHRSCFSRASAHWQGEVRD